MEVRTVKQLGELRELLKSQPQIASLIRSFRFIWDMGGDSHEWKLRAFRQGTALDLAFCDRLQLWDDLMKEPGADAEIEGADGFVDYNKSLTQPPGEGHDWEAAAAVGPADYDWLAGTGGRGPDGKGEDRLIKNAEQFAECITEVVSMLSLLQTFGWETGVTPMPRGVFDALARLTTLMDLRMAFSTYRSNVSECEFVILHPACGEIDSCSTTESPLAFPRLAVPLWEICGQLRALCLDFHYEEDHFR